MRTFSLVCAVALSASVVGAAGCSVINSFDDLKQEVTAGAGGTGATGGTAGQGGTGNAGSGGSAGGGTGGMAGTGGAAVKPGLVVVAGEGDLTAGGRGLVISALSPYNGDEYTREEFGANKNGFIAYDGVDDYWYVWTQEGAVTDLYTFHVWKFDRADQQFKELGNGSVPAPTGVIAVLNKRVLYWSIYKEGASAPTQGFTLIKVDDPSKPAPTTPLQDTSLTVSPVAAIPRANGTDAGGTVNLFVKNGACAPDGTQEGGQDVNMCEVQRYLASITPAATKPGFAGSPLVIGKVRQSGGSIGAIKASDDDAVIFPDPAWEKDTNANKGAKVTRYNPTNFSASGSIAFDVKGSFIRGAAWDPCDKIFFATESLSDTAIFAVPTAGGGTTFRQGITTPPVGAVYFDQYTRTIFQPRDSTTNFGLRAFLLGGTAAAPTLTERDPSSALPWNPPSDLLPKQVEVETPVKPVCQ